MKVYLLNPIKKGFRFHYEKANIFGVTVVDEKDLQKPEIQTLIQSGLLSVTEIGNKIEEEKKSNTTRKKSAKKKEVSAKTKEFFEDSDVDYNIDELDSGLSETNS